jgi:hypothetical protein
VDVPSKAAHPLPSTLSTTNACTPNRPRLRKLSPCQRLGKYRLYPSPTTHPSTSPSGSRTSGFTPPSSSTTTP